MEKLPNPALAVCLSPIHFSGHFWPLASLTPCGRNGDAFCCGLYREFRLTAVAIGKQAHFFMFGCLPRMVKEDIVALLLSP